MKPEDLIKRLDLRMPRMDIPVYRDFNAERQMEIIRSIQSVPQQHAESVQEAILAHIKQLQDKLGPEEELLVTCYMGPEVIRVHQVGMPNWHVLILSGVDGKNNATSFIMNMHTVQMACKVTEVVPPEEPMRIGFILPDREEMKR